MAAPAHIARENGKKGGRPKGRKDNKTIEREAARKAYEQLVLENLRPIFQKQLWNGMGQTYVYRKEKHGTGASMRIEHVLLEEPHEIADALDIIANSDVQDEDTDGYVYITTRSPDNRALDSMLDRSIGKPNQNVDLTSKGKAISGNAIVFTNFKNATDRK